MRLDTAPKSLFSEILTVSDFVVLGSRFAEIIKAKIPTSRTVTFLSEHSFYRSDIGMANLDKELLFKRVIMNGMPEKAGEAAFVLPLDLSGNGRLVALVAGVDTTVVSKTSIGWLCDTNREVMAEFVRQKKNYTDPVSGLYNSVILSEFTTEAQDAKNNLHLVLVELLPAVRMPRDVFTNVKRAARSLAEYNRDNFALFHIGQSIFGIIVPERDRDFLKRFCLSLIGFIKTKGFKRVHCGCSSINIIRDPEQSRGATDLLLDEAWTALHAACRRGPFAFCDFDLLANPSHFALQAVSRSTIAKLQRRWQNYPCFSLIFFKPDFKDLHRLTDLMVRYFGSNNYIAAEGGIFVIKKEVDTEHSKQWAQTAVDNIVRENGSGYSLSAGISCFPFKNYSRTEIIRNCQKALLHGSFFGYGSIVVFDEISLNVSGDAYYSEGDLIGAVKEYRKGLDIDMTNINLLNSLGVTYALMNRSHEAQAAFQAVLNVDPDNFMALYNKGLGEQLAGRYEEAAICYDHALKIIKKKGNEQVDLPDDLICQRGVVSFYTKDYKKTIECLEKWYVNKKGEGGAGKYCRFIGISYLKLSSQIEAKTWLQRAVVFDEDDAESLSLLGELYFNSGEGEDISFKLLEKSVEIDAANKEYALRYGRCLNHNGMHERAVPILRGCLKSPSVRHKAWYELLIAYKGLKKYNKARFYLKKLNDGPGVDNALRIQARKIKREIAQGNG